MLVGLHPHHNTPMITPNKISIAAIVFFADKMGGCASFFGILDGQELAIMPAIMFGILVFLLPAIAYATSTKQYNGFGEKIKGAKTCRRCAFMIALLGLAGTIMTVVAPASEDASILPIAAIFGIALLWFIMELVLSPIKKAKDPREEIVEEPVEEIVEE